MRLVLGYGALRYWLKVDEVLGDSRSPVLPAAQHGQGILPARAMQELPHKWRGAVQRHTVACCQEPISMSSPTKLSVI